MPDDNERKPPRRLQTATERELESERARREHEHAHVRRTPVHGVPQQWDDDITGKYEGDELDRMRSKRPTDKRFQHLETKHDELVKDMKETGTRLGKLEVVVAEQVGEMKILPDLVRTMQNATTALQQRDHVTFTAKVDVDKAKAIAETDVDKAERLDQLDARKHKRRRLTKIIAAAVGAVASGGIIHWLLGML